MLLTRIHQLCSAEGNLKAVKSTIEAHDKAWAPLIGSCWNLDGNRELMVQGKASLTVKIWSFVINNEQDWVGFLSLWLYVYKEKGGQLYAFEVVLIIKKFQHNQYFYQINQRTDKNHL